MLSISERAYQVIKVDAIGDDGNKEVAEPEQLMRVYTFRQTFPVLIPHQSGTVGPCRCVNQVNQTGILLFVNQIPGYIDRAISRLLYRDNEDDEQQVEGAKDGGYRDFSNEKLRIGCDSTRKPNVFYLQEPYSSQNDEDYARYSFESYFKNHEFVVNSCVCVCITISTLWIIYKLDEICY